jgi:hypothetical protein
MDIVAITHSKHAPQIEQAAVGFVLKRACFWTSHPA